MSKVYQILYCISRLIPRKAVSILAYHSIGRDPVFYAVTPEEFEKQMRYLKGEYNVVSLDEIIDFVGGKKVLPKNSVAITFDDGYHDNYLNAYPILKKYGLPATIFIASGYIGKEMPLSGVRLRMLNLEEMREMSQNNINFGAHTVSHQNLTEIDLEEAKSEILRSKCELEEKTGKKVEYFAYPKGRCNELIVNIVKSLGFKGAFAGRGLIQRGDNLFMLKRIEIVNSDTFATFKAKLTKTYWQLQKCMDIGFYLKKDIIFDLKHKHFPFIRKIWKKKYYVIPLKRGLKAILTERDYNTDKGTFHEIFEDEVYKTDYKNSYVFDLGGHKGYYALYALLKGASKVHIYEPEEFNFEILKKNIELNKLSKKVVLNNCAVDNESGIKDFYVADAGWSHSLYPRNDKKNIKTIRIRTSSINDVLSNVEEYKKYRVIVKMDIEGSECNVIFSIHDVFMPRISELFIEHHPFSPCSKEEIVEYLRKKQFKLVSIRGDVLHFKRGELNGR